MDAYFVRLPNRGLIHIEGPDRKAFLQALITNDTDKLEPGKTLYACLLTPQGKFLHDFFIHDGEDFLLLDCEGGARAQDLFKRLSLYKMRSDVQISVEEENEVYAILPPMSSRPKRSEVEGSPDKKGDPSTTDLGPFAQDDSWFKDPRHPEMGNRSFEKPDLPEEPFATWDTHRIRLCIPDGSRDLIPEQSTMDEARMDKLNAIDYEKGCYIGQELTARMHYRGLGKKHLHVVEINNLPENANLRSSCGKLGLALMKDKP